MGSHPKPTGQVFTTLFVENATSRGKTVREFFDAGCTGLRIRVTSYGKKTWTFVYTSPRNGRRARITLGTYPSTGLGEAREIAGAKRHVIERGVDPRDLSPGSDLKEAAHLIAAFARLAGPQQRRAALDFMKAMADGLSARPRNAISSK